MAAAYLETLRSFSSSVLSAGCDAFRSKGSAFPPSADELFVECQRQQEIERKRNESVRAIDFNRYRLPPPEKHGYSLDQLANWRLIINGTGKYVLRVDENDNPLRIPSGYPGAGNPAVWGYLTPDEASAAADARASAANRRKNQYRNYHEAAE